MAVYTRVTRPELERFLAAYDLGALVEAREIIEGVENSNYLLLTDKTRAILTLYEKRVKAEDLPFFIEMMQHAAKNGLACPAPIADKNGTILQELAGRPATIVSFLNGDKVLDPSPVHCREAGKLMAQLHKATVGMQRTRVNALNAEGWQKLATACAPRADEAAPGMRELIEGELNTIRNAWPKNLPAGIIHADFFPDNVFFMGEKTSGVIDFYFACHDYLAYDLMITLNSWCFEGQKKYSAQRAHALIEGYESVRPLSADEKQALPLLARGAALRFLLTRLYDVLNHPPGALVKPHNPLEYRDKLVFFRDQGLPL